MPIYGIPAKVQPPTMPTGAWEVNTQCAQATNLAGFLDIERRRLWWKGQWVPLTFAGVDRTTATSLPMPIGGSAVNAQTASGWLYSAAGALTPGIGTSTPFTAHTWALTSLSDNTNKGLFGLSGAAGVNTDRITFGDNGGASPLCNAIAKTVGGLTFTSRHSVTVPLANVVYAVTMISRVDTFPDIYLNGVANNGTAAQDNGGVRPSVLDQAFFGALNTAGAQPLLGVGAYWGIWEGKLSANAIYSLWDPNTRWDLMWQKKTSYFDISPPANQDVPPSQYARPRYLSLNEFSPQAQGLVAWLPSVDGAFVQAQCPSSSTLLNTFGGDSTNIPNYVVPQVNPSGLNATVSPGDRKPSDFGMVPMSTKDMNPVGNTRSVYAFTPEIDVSGLSDATFVYWVYPLPQVFQEAGYWSWTTTSTEGMTDLRVALGTSPAQVLTFSNGDPHRRGRWQMITVARTLAGITIWRDLEIVERGSVAGGPLTSAAVDNVMLIGAVYEASASAKDGVNALWADFRVYNRAWTQVDVEYAFKPETRWDYYLQLGVKPWELPFGPPPVITGFAGTMVGDWGGSSVFAE